MVRVKNSVIAEALFSDKQFVNEVRHLYLIVIIIKMA